MTASLATIRAQLAAGQVLAACRALVALGQAFVACRVLGLKIEPAAPGVPLVGWFDLRAATVFLLVRPGDTGTDLETRLACILSASVFPVLAEVMQ